MKKIDWIVIILLTLAIASGAICFFTGERQMQKPESSEAGTLMETESEETTEHETTEAAPIKIELQTESETQTETELQPEQQFAEIRELPAGEVLSVEELDEENMDQYFVSFVIEEEDHVFRRINGKSYRKNNNILLSDLRYLKLLHYNFDHQIQVGEMVVHKNVEEDIREIFKELFEQEYEIQSMHLIDDYWTGDGDSSDYASIEVNNTSAFCYREVTGGSNLSNHAYGLAIDINPQQNPYVKTRNDGSRYWAHENANDFIKRDSELPHVITHQDPAYILFKEHGFEWGGDWNNPKDYQHFDKRENLGR